MTIHKFFSILSLVGKKKKKEKGRKITKIVKSTS